MKQCQNCGEILNDTAFFCSKCGGDRFVNIEQPNPQQNGQPYQPYGQPHQPYGQPQPPYGQPQQPYGQQYNEPRFDGGNNGQTYQQTPPMGNVSQEEFVNKYAPDLKKSVRSVAITGYICGGATALLAILLSPLGLIDAALMIGLSIAYHKTMKMGVAIGLCVLGAIEVIIGIMMGSVPFLWLAVGVSAIITANNIKKRYELFKRQNGIL